MAISTEQWALEQEEHLWRMFESAWIWAQHSWAAESTKTSARHHANAISLFYTMSGAKLLGGE